MSQVFLKVFTGSSVNLISFQPDAAFHQDLVECVVAFPHALVKMANLCQAIVCSPGVVGSASTVEERSVLFPQRRRRRTYHQYWAFIWEIARNIDAKSVAVPVVCVDVPFYSCVAFRCGVKPRHVPQFVRQNPFLHTESPLLLCIPTHSQRCNIDFFKSH